MEGVAIIAGIDRILDMARTTVNVCGDMMVSVLVAKSENELDKKVYNKELVEQDFNATIQGILKTTEVEQGKVPSSKITEGVNS